MKSKIRFLNVAVAASFFLIASVVLAGQCKTDPEVVGSCFQVHGRMFSSNGAPVTRIWRIGTKRILGVPGSLPTSLERLINDMDDVIYADFLVCPLTPQVPGEMQMVCVEPARHVVHRREP